MDPILRYLEVLYKGDSEGLKTKTNDTSSEKQFPALYKEKLKNN